MRAYGINNIGYNLYPRNRNYPVIKDCGLQVVTAQFLVTCYPFGETVYVLGYNDGSEVSIDWGDGMIEHVVPSPITGMIAVSHTYFQAKVNYLVSVYANECYDLQVVDTEKTVKLSTVPIEGLGYGMMATISESEQRSLSAISLNDYPFYDALNISQTTCDVLQLANYGYLSMLTCNNQTLQTVTVTDDTMNNMIFVNLGRCRLLAGSMDSILQSLDQDMNENGACILNNQNPPTTPANQTAIASLREKGWNIQVDRL